MWLETLRPLIVPLIFLAIWVGAATKETPMRFEILIQFIVPLTFLAIWALTSLLNRDAQPLPPRPGRPPGPGELAR